MEIRRETYLKWNIQNQAQKILRQTYVINNVWSPTHIIFLRSVDSVRVSILLELI